MTRRKTPPRFYFSLRSPYSWLAYHDLLTRYGDLAERLEWRPFFEPDEHSAALLAEAGGEFPYTPMGADKSRYILQDVKRLAADRGLEFRWPVDRAPVWEVPHLAYLLAAERGRGREFIALAARTRWERGQDICDEDVVASWGAELGIEPDLLASAAKDPELRAAGVRALLDIERDGVFGVPFFAVGYDKFWGVDRLPAFAAAVAGRTPAPVTGEDPTGRTDVPVDDGHAGGCG